MRDVHLNDWLSGTEWATWRRSAPISDASARRYLRLKGPRETTVILMDAPPETCGSQSRFVDIATHLRALDLAAPDIFAWDDMLGFMVLEDLGQTDFATHLATTSIDEKHLYSAAVNTLRVVQSAPPPSDLLEMTPDVGADMIDLAFEWAATDNSESLAQQIKTLLRDKLSDIQTKHPVLSLRDFHAENLIWRPGRAAKARVGLIDFQDAFAAHPAYDLASLMRDARRDVDPALLDPLLRQLAPDAFDETKAAFHILAVQRNLRILGIFERLAGRDGKSGYRRLIPRVWAHLKTDLATPELADLAPLVLQAFDPETRHT